MVAVVDDVNLGGDGRFDGRQQIFSLEWRLFLFMFDTLDAITTEELEQILTVSNKAAGITTSRHGAIPAMPTKEEVFVV